jgi:hypothetical protein
LKEKHFISLKEECQKRECVPAKQNPTFTDHTNALQQKEKSRLKAVFPEASETEICKMATHFVAQKPGLVLTWGTSLKVESQAR